MRQHVRPVNKSFCLQMLCEQNFTRFNALHPVSTLTTKAHQTIRARVLERGPYTYTVLIDSQSFNPSVLDVQFKCRIYIDTQSIEVISIEGSNSPATPDFASPKACLNYKWNINYLLEKWIMFQFQLSNIKPPRSQVLYA